jgi:hypothetical protein
MVWSLTVRLFYQKHHEKNGGDDDQLSDVRKVSAAD